MEYAFKLKKQKQRKENIDLFFYFVLQVNTTYLVWVKCLHSTYFKNPGNTLSATEQQQQKQEYILTLSNMIFFN